MEVRTVVVDDQPPTRWLLELSMRERELTERALRSLLKEMEASPLKDLLPHSDVCSIIDKLVRKGGGDAGRV